MISTLLNTRGTRAKRRVSVTAALAATAALGLALAGCTAGTNPSSTSTTGTGGSASGISIVVMGGATNDPFWSTVKNGGQAAAAGVEKAGGKVTFLAMPNYNNFNADAAKLVANILAQKPSAAVIPDWAPEAQNANIKAITDAGIPVFIYNTGADQVKAVGATAYVGSNDYSSGKLAGETFAKQGSKHALCVNTLPGTATAEARCKGLSDGASAEGGKATTLSLPSSQFGDPTAIAQAIKGAVLQDPTVDAIFTISQGDADSAASGLSQASATDKVKLGSTDFNTAALGRISKGTQLFAIDQQGYAQGYYAVAAAFQFAAYGIALPGDLLTGPAIIDKANVDKATAGVKAGAR